MKEKVLLDAEEICVINSSAKERRRNKKCLTRNAKPKLNAKIFRFLRHAAVFRFFCDVAAGNLLLEIINLSKGFAANF
jgi:hypothetical protein